jgi:hypothetical protein
MSNVVKLELLLELLSQNWQLWLSRLQVPVHVYKSMLEGPVIPIYSTYRACHSHRLKASLSKEDLELTMSIFGSSCHETPIVRQNGLLCPLSSFDSTVPNFAKYARDSRALPILWTRSRKPRKIRYEVQ